MKYIAELNLNFDKEFCKQWILQSPLKLDDREIKRWFKNVPVDDALKNHFGPITDYLNDVVMIATMFPNVDTNLHADGAGTNTHNTYRVALNIPVSNCNETTKTIFWDFEDGRPIEYISYEQYGVRDIADKDNLIRAQEYVLKDKAVIFRNEYPHSVENNNEEVRQLLSWRFKPGYSWQQAIEICNKLELL